MRSKAVLTETSLSSEMPNFRTANQESTRSPEGFCSIQVERCKTQSLDMQALQPDSENISCIWGPEDLFDTRHKSWAIYGTALKPMTRMSCKQFCTISERECVAMLAYPESRNDEKHKFIICIRLSSAGPVYYSAPTEKTLS